MITMKRNRTPVMLNHRHIVRLEVKKKEPVPFTFKNAITLIVVTAIFGLIGWFVQDKYGSQCPKLWVDTCHVIGWYVWPLGYCLFNK